MRAACNQALAALAGPEGFSRQLRRTAQRLFHERIRMQPRISYDILNTSSARAVGAEAEDAKIDKLLSELKGKDIKAVIAAGSEKLAKVGSGGGGGGAAAPAAAAGGAAPAAKKEEKKARLT